MIFRMVTLAAAVLTLNGCEAYAAQQREQAAQHEAEADSIRARVAALSPEERDKVSHCSYMAGGRIEALRAAGQGGPYRNVDENTVVSGCLTSVYWFEGIPAQPAAVNVYVPPTPVYTPAPSPSINCTTTSITPGVSNTNCH